MHRLVPWLNRELLCLCVHNDEPISYMVQTIQNIIQTVDMTSPEFRNRIRPLVPNHTDHFIHELINYARSPYDLIGYDRYVTYSPRFESDDVVNIFFSKRMIEPCKTIENEVHFDRCFSRIWHTVYRLLYVCDLFTIKMSKYTVYL